MSFEQWQKENAGLLEADKPQDGFERWQQENTQLATATSPVGPIDVSDLRTRLIDRPKHIVKVQRDTGLPLADVMAIQQDLEDDLPDIPERERMPLSVDVARAVRESPQDLWIGTIRLGANVLSAIKRRAMLFSGARVTGESPYEVVKPSAVPTAEMPLEPLRAEQPYLPMRPPELPGAIAGQAFGVVTRLPDVGQNILNEKANRLAAAQDRATIRNAPVTTLAKMAMQGGVPSVFASAGVSILTGDPLIGLAILAETSSGQEYEELLQAGVSPMKAQVFAEMNGAAEAAGEALVFPKFVKGLTQGIPLSKAIVLIAENAGQEGWTGFNQAFTHTYAVERQNGKGIRGAAVTAYHEGVKAIAPNAAVGGLTAGLIDATSLPASIYQKEKMPTIEEAQSAQAKEEAGAEGTAPLAAGAQEAAPGSEAVQRAVPEAGDAGAVPIVAPEAAGAAEGVKPGEQIVTLNVKHEQTQLGVRAPYQLPEGQYRFIATEKRGKKTGRPSVELVPIDENGNRIQLRSVDDKATDTLLLDKRTLETLGPEFTVQPSLAPAGTQPTVKESLTVPAPEQAGPPEVRRAGGKQAWEMSARDFADRTRVLTPMFQKTLNDAYFEAGKNQGKLFRHIDAGTVGDALAPDVISLFPPEVRDVRILFVSKINGEHFTDFANGIYEGKPAIFMHPEQPANDYVPGILHELKHIADKIGGKEVTITPNAQADYAAYQKLPSERRARHGETTLQRYHKKAVRDAIKQGQPVPRAVLEEYKSEKWADEALAKLGEQSPASAEIVPPAKRGEAEKATTTIGQPAISQTGEVPAEQAGTAQPEIDNAVSEWQTSVGAASFSFGESRDAISRAILESQQNLKPRYVVQNDEGKFDVIDNPPEKGHYTSVDMSRAVDEQVVFIKQASPTIEEAFDYGEHPKESQKQWTDLERFKAKLKEETANAQSIADELLHYVKNLPLADQAKFTPLLMKISPDRRATTNVKDLMAGIVKVQRILSGNEKADAISELKKVYHTIRKKYREGREVLGKLDNAARDRIFDLMGTIDLTKMTGAKEKQLESLGKAVNELAKELGTAAKEMNTSLAAELLEVPEGQIEELARLGKTSIHEMDAEDIRQITDTLLYIVNQWEVSKSEAHEKRVAGVRTRVVSAIQNVHKRVKRIGEVVETFPVIRYVKGRAQSRIDTLVKRSMGKDHAAATSLLMDDLEIGQEKTFGKFFEMADYEAAQLTAIGWDNDAHKDLNKLVTVSLGGETFEIPIRKLAILYAHMQSEDNYTAILKSEGLVIRYKTREAKRGYSSAYRTIYTNQATAEELMSAVAGLPDVYKQLVRVMFETNEKLAAPAMNETSLRLKATEIAKIKNYVHRPRETDANVEGGTMDVSVAPEHRGRAQPRTGGTRRIVLGNIDDEMIAQMQFAAEYYGMTEPLENARALLNNKDFNGTMNKSGQGENLKSIKKQFRRAQGVFADQTVLEKRMNRSLAKVGRSILSLRVSGGLVQLTSPPTSWGVIDAKYFVGVLPGTPSEIAALKERYAVLRNRWDLGGFHFIIGDVAGAQIFRNLLMGKSEVLDKPLHHYTWGDEGAISMIYKATRKKVAGETPFEDGSAEFENAVDNLFRVAMRTQGQYDMLHRSEITSDPNPFWRGSTMFMSSLNAFYNTILQATDDARKGRISSVRATETMAGIGIAIALAVMVRRAFVKGGKWLVQALLAAILPPDEEEKENLARLEADIPAEMKKELRALPGRIAFESLGLMVFGRVFATIGRRVADKIAGKNYQDRPSRMETGNIFTDLVLDLTELGGDAGTLAGQIARDEEFESGPNEGKKKWKPTARRVTDELAGLVAYRFGLPYSAIQSDFGQPAGQIIEAVRISRMTTDELDTEIEKNTYKETSEDETREAGDPHKGKELYVSLLLTELRKR